MISLLILILSIIFLSNLLDLLILLPQRNINIPCNPWLSEGGILSGNQRSITNKDLWKSFWIIHLDFGPIISFSVLGEKYIIIIIVLSLILFSLYESNNIIGINKNNK